MNFKQEGPIWAALENYRSLEPLRLHMPGHKGILPGAFKDIAPYDLTELSLTGNLYEGGFPFSESEERLAELAGARQCLFISGGTTQGIFTAMAAACPPGSGVLVDRGSHRSVYNAMALLNLEPMYINRGLIEPFFIGGPLEPERVEAALSENPAAALVLTSPSYYGVLSDVAKIAEICKANGVSLIVDEAHGAHLPFMRGYESAARLGADIALTSAHKTLPALGQGAMIYTGTDKYCKAELRR